MNRFSKNLQLQAIFLDRDGVIVHNRKNYIRRWEDVRFYPSSLQALRLINHLPNRPKVFIITNQSAIGRGLITIEQYKEIDHKFHEVIIKHDGVVDQVYFCPHTPEENCDCRKPRPGMILKAVNQFGIDLSNSILVGDAQSDIEAGFLAGIPYLFLVTTGRGKKQVNSILELPYLNQVYFHNNLLEVIKTIF